MFQLLAKLTKPVVIDDHEVKKKIIGKYGFVDNCLLYTSDAADE